MSKMIQGTVVPETVAIVLEIQELLFREKLASPPHLQVAAMEIE